MTFSQERTLPITAVSFPKEVIPVKAGKIQITAKFNGLWGAISKREPFLFCITDGTSTYKLGFDENLLNLGRHAGLVAEAGNSYYTGTIKPVFEGVNLYDSVLRGDDVNQWHVYTLQWNENGIPGIKDGTIKLAVFVDGILNSGTWSQKANAGFKTLSNGVLNLATQGFGGFLPGEMQLKDLKIYDSGNNIILYNKLGTQYQIEHSIIGPNGTFNGGGNAKFIFSDEIQDSILSAHPIYSIGEPGAQLSLQSSGPNALQHNELNYYFIAPVKISGLFSNISYSISGSTIRTGYGIDATGEFQQGVSVITWKAINAINERVEVTTTVEVASHQAGDPVWVYPSIIHTYEDFIHKKYLIASGDINKDENDDIVIYHAYDYYFYNLDEQFFYDKNYGAPFTFFGSNSGLRIIPDTTKLQGIYGHGGYLLHFVFNSVGDVNNDGYADFMSGNPYGVVQLYYGSDSGINRNLQWTWKDNDEIQFYDFHQPASAGDLNGDGFGDVALSGLLDSGGPAYVFYGSSGGLKDNYDWNFPHSGAYKTTAQSAGDINEDGFDELLVIRKNLGDVDSIEQVFLFLGASSGISKIANWEYKSRLGDELECIAPGDINGDTFDDLVISEYNFIDTIRHTYIFYGSSSGLNTIPDTIPFKRNLSALGDFNGDGYADISAAGIIFYGSKYGLSLKGDTIFQRPNLTAAGDINNDGFSDIIGETNSEFRLYYGYSSIPISIDCPEDQVYCFKKDEKYTVSKLSTKGQVSTISFSITGKTKRSGSGSDASGYFSTGTSIITWTITDSKGRTLSCSSRIVIKPRLEIDIPDNYTTHHGSAPNTIYLGYGSQYLLLKTTAKGGTPPYTYKWSNGSISAAVKTDLTQVGTYNYTVTLTDSKGCTAIDSVKVKVVDVRCNNKLTSLLNKYLPGWQAWTPINNYIKKNSFIMVCVPVNGKYVTTCVPFQDVAPLLAKGAKLGACHPNSQLIVQTETYRDPKADEIFSVKVSPNPSSVGFNLEVNGNINEPLQIIIRDPLGRMVERINCAYTSRLVIGSKLQKGMYFVEVSQGSRNEVVKIIKF